nr:glycosyltransferase family 4 protein [uncultured Roseateles sp.]
MSKPLRSLLFSSLYPSSVRPGHGIFVETRLRELLVHGDVQVRVIAPVPWFYSSDPKHGVHGLMAATPRREQWHDIDVQHPRYPLPPKVGMHIAPLSLALGAVPAIRRLLREGFDFDVIDAHYFYPDGVAAGLLAKWFGKPFVVTARGSDLNLIAGYPLPRRMMQWAARRADGVIGVSQALADVLLGWGLDAAKVHTMRNGVDLERFYPMSPDAAKLALQMERGAPVLLSVGNLVELKGHDLAIKALATISADHPAAQLVIVGEGEERSNLETLATKLGLSHRVRFAGAIPNLQLAAWYSAADVLILASSREGWANVLLESMACGTPVVATRVGGNAEVVASASAGRLAATRDADGIAAAVLALLAQEPSRAEVRRYAEQFSWQATSEAQLTLFRQIAGRDEGAPHDGRGVRSTNRP